MHKIIKPLISVFREIFVGRAALHTEILALRQQVAVLKRNKPRPSLRVGNGKILESGEVRALDIKAGDKVLFGKYSGTEVKVDGEELLVMKEDDIMAVIEG